MSEPHQTLEAEAIRPTAERMAKGDVIERAPERGRREAKPWYAAENIISVYLVDKVITERQARAGFQFQEVYYRGNGSPCRAASWSPPIAGSVNDYTDNQVSAKGQLRAYRERLGPDLYSCMEGVCGLGQTHSRWAADRHDHPSSGKVMMRAALTLHANYLKLPED